jgi:hypothetical protein
VARWGLLVHRAPIEHSFTDSRPGLTSVCLLRHTVSVTALQLQGIGCFCSGHGGCPNVTKTVVFCDMTALTASQAIRETPRGSFVPLSALPGPSVAARQAASRATRSGELVAVKPGLYYRGAKTRYGMTRPPVEEIVREVWGSTGVGPAGFSAAREWGVTTQVPKTFSVAALWTVAPIDGVTQYSRRNRARGELNPERLPCWSCCVTPESSLRAAGNPWLIATQTPGRGDWFVKAFWNRPLRLSATNQFDTILQH